MEPMVQLYKTSEDGPPVSVEKALDIWRAKLADLEAARETVGVETCRRQIKMLEARQAAEAEADFMSDHPDAGGPPYATFNK